jgi:hypothetical protein
MAAISNFIKRIDAHLSDFGTEPLENSPAKCSIDSYPRPKSLRTAFSQATMCFLASGDYLLAVDSLVEKKIFAVAPWACARGVLEAGAIASWLFALNIDSQERVCRSLALRYSSLLNQKKYFRAKGMQEGVRKAEDKIKEVEGTAEELGFSRCVNKKGERSGIGMIMPSYTDLVKQQLGGLTLYRRLCGMVHSDYSSLLQHSFQRMVHEDTDSGAVLFMGSNVSDQRELLAQISQIYVRLAWMYAVQFGIDKASVAALFELLFNEMEKLSSTEKFNRFWRELL